MARRFFAYLLISLMVLPLIQSQSFADCTMDHDQMSMHQNSMDMDHSAMSMEDHGTRMQDCDCTGGMGHCLVSADNGFSATLASIEIEKNKAIKPAHAYNSFGDQRDRDIYFADIPPPKIKQTLRDLSILLLI